MTDDPTRDAEWAWVAAAYRQTPPAGPAAVEQVVARVRAAPSRRASGRGRRLIAAAGAAAAAVTLLVVWRGEDRPHPAPPPGAAARTPAPTGDPPVAPSPADDAATPSPAPDRPVAGHRREPRGPMALSPDHDGPLPGPAPAESLRTEGVPHPGIDPESPLPPPVQRYLGDSATARLVLLLRRAEERGLPTAVVVDHLLEGVARQASDRQIIAVAGRLVERLDAARAALGAAATKIELEAGAHALGAGATPDMVRRLGAAGPPERVAVALIALRGLTTDGVPAHAAAEALVELVEGGIPELGIAMLRRDVARDVSHGVAPLDALRSQVTQRRGETWDEPGTPTPREDLPDPLPDPRMRRSLP